MVVTCTGACLGLALGYRPQLVLALAVAHVLASRGLSQICKYETPHKYNAWSAKNDMLHDHARLTHVNPYKLFTNLPLSFLVF
jgi:hypothetical protein